MSVSHPKEYRTKNHAFRDFPWESDMGYPSMNTSNRSMSCFSSPQLG
jgi:hypothetical protein